MNTRAMLSLGLSSLVLGGTMVGCSGQGMSLASAGNGHAGLRMGVWGAAQAAAFGLGSLAGPALLDMARLATADASRAYTLVFLAEAGLFLVSARLAGGTVGGVRVEESRPQAARPAADRSRASL